MGNPGRVFPVGFPHPLLLLKPKVILFVSKCFDQMLERLYCLKMKGVFVRVIFHSSALFIQLDQ